MMKSKTKQVVFEMLEILMFLRNKAPKISQIPAYCFWFNCRVTSGDLSRLILYSTQVYKYGHSGTF